MKDCVPSSSCLIVDGVARFVKERASVIVLQKAEHVGERLG